MKEKLYKKEIWITVVFSILLLLVGHSATLFRLFPSMQQGTIWGFPTHYILPIILGWFGLMAVCAVMAIVCNKFDDEMESLADQAKSDRIAVSKQA
jgi:hypothetical protein